jgi:serine/threonine-protein kinase
MGVVYKARDKRLDRVVALKFLGPAQADRPEALERFRREAHAIAALSHPNIAVVYEVGEWDEEPFLALEFLPGGTLRDRVREGGLGLEEILHLAKQLGAGLDYTHRRGVLHRDIKPANCMFSPHGELKLVDFGLAKLTAWSEVTRPGSGALGTIPYMAPEILNGEPASVRSEVYSFGALIYELAAGRPMYSAPSAEALCRKVLHDPPEPISAVRRDLPSYLGKAVAHASARDPKDRPASVAAVLGEMGIGAQISTGDSNAATQTLQHPQRRPRSNRLVPIAAIVFGLLLLTVAISWFASFGPFRRSVSLTDQTVVVLPFENLSSDPTGQTLAAGLMETVTSMLSRAGKPQDTLLVVPSVEVRRDQVQTISDARKLFNATLAVSGSVQKSSNGLQVTLALTDVRTVRLKDSIIISLPPDAAGLENALAESLSRLFGVALARESQAQPGQRTANATSYALYVQGEGALDDRSYDEAVNLLQKAVDADPAFAKARAKLALAHLRSYLVTKDRVSLAKGDEEANRAAEAGVTPDVLLVQALVRDATGDSDRAIALFRQYQQVEPNDVEAYGLLADVLRKAGHNEEAESTLQQAIRLRPGYWPTYQRLGIFYLNQQQFDQAEHSLLTAIGIAPEIASLHYNLGALYFMRNRWPAAAAEFEKSLAIRPTALAYSNLGTVEFFEGKYEEAVRQFEQATQLQPNNAINWGNLGDALWQLPDKRDRAREAFMKADVLVSEQLSLDPASGLRRFRAVYLIKLGKIAEALAEIRRVLERQPKDAEVQFFAARVYVSADMPAEALHALRNAVEFGYSAGEIEREPDFARLRQDRAFQQLVAGHAK